MLAFAPLGHGIKSGMLELRKIIAIAQRVNKTPAHVGGTAWDCGFDDTEDS
jgi:hypothetical protein